MDRPLGPGGKLEEGSGWLGWNRVSLNGCGGRRGFLLLSERGGFLRGGADEAVSAYRPLIESTELGVRQLLQELMPTGGGAGPSRLG